MKKNIIMLSTLLLTTSPCILHANKDTKKNSKKETILLKKGDSLNIAEFTEIYPPAITKSGEIQTDPILFKITKKGHGDKPLLGETLTVHYTGYLLEDNSMSTHTMITRSKKDKKDTTVSLGIKFDSSVDRGTPFQFKLGAKQVISGWEISLADMKIGEKRIVILPAKQAYGNRATAKIPANSTLIFEIELISAS